MPVCEKIDSFKGLPIIVPYFRINANDRKNIIAITII